MIVGKVVGSVVSTRKCEKLIGSKFMIIEPVHLSETCVYGALPRYIPLSDK